MVEIVPFKFEIKKIAVTREGTPLPLPPNWTLFTLVPIILGRKSIGSVLSIFFKLVELHTSI